MITDPVPQDKTEYESKPTITYADYRTLCDETQPDVYRKTGIDSSEGYEAAQNDSRTVYVELDGHRIPLFVPLEDVGGYNIEGSQRLTERENMYVLALPLEFIEDNELDLNTYLEALNEDSAVIVQTHSTRTHEAKAMLSEKLVTGAGWTPHDFVDPRCPEGHQTASIAMYDLHFEAVDDNGSPIPPNDRPIRELVEEDARETGETMTELIEARDIREREGLFEQLWEIHDDKFDELGRFHPVSMQEDIDFYRERLNDERTKSYVRFDIDENGERVPVCQGIEFDDMGQAGWIRESDREGTVLFFYGIAGKKSADKNKKYAEDVMGLMSRIGKKRGGKSTRVFESTNLSGLYMPGLVEQYVGREPNGVKMTGPAVMVSKLDYWYLSSPSKETV